MSITTALRRAQEEPEQFARHAEIARRYAWDDRQRQRGRRPRSFAMLRLRELERFFADVYGPVLPDDDAGRAELFNVAQHIAQGGALDRHFPAWCSLWTPWVTADEIADIIARVVERPERWSADTLAWRVGLNDETRSRLMINTIGATGCGKAERAERRKQQNTAAHRERRAVLASGRNRPVPAATEKPWEAAGVSRSTWYRRRGQATSKPLRLPGARSRHGIPQSATETATVRLEPSAVDNTITADNEESHQGEVSPVADQGVEASLAALNARPRQSLADFLRIATSRYPQHRIGDLDGALSALQRCIDAGHRRGRIVNVLSALAYAALNGEQVPILSNALVSLLDERSGVSELPSPCNDQIVTTGDRRRRRST